ncbi:hypothetical protein, partial [Microvirga aerophila]|uniref:hypothetical protein n=1 Tax=Microvirga aerophila TaxID=670291 RepID=UPI001AEC7767
MIGVTNVQWALPQEIRDAQADPAQQRKFLEWPRPRSHMPSRPSVAAVRRKPCLHRQRRADRQKTFTSLLTAKISWAYKAPIGGEVMFGFAAGVFGALGWKVFDPGV